MYIYASMSLSLQHLHSVATHDDLHSFAFSKDGCYLISGGSYISIRSIMWNCSRVCRMPVVTDHIFSDPATGKDLKQCGYCGIFKKEAKKQPINNAQIQWSCPRRPVKVRSLLLSHNERHLLVGLQSGQMYVYALGAEFQSRRFTARMKNVGF